MDCLQPILMQIIIDHLNKNNIVAVKYNTNLIDSYYMSGHKQMNAMISVINGTIRTLMFRIDCADPDFLDKLVKVIKCNQT